MKFKYLHCVPTFDNPATLADVVSELLISSTNDILVVDDASKIQAETLLKNLRESSLSNSERLFIVRFDENQGKGIALRKAFQWALDNNYTHVLSSDADAQHPASEVLKVYKRSLIEPWSLVIGNRNMNTANVPGISQFGRKFSNFWVKYQTDAPIADSQSGLRCYPLIHVQNWNFFTRRFDFEIEVLIRLIWSGVDVVEEPVQVVYQEGSARVSHFDKLWDNVRITALNTLLIILSLLKEQSSPLKLAAAFGVGIFVGCTPFYGFHLLICAAISFFLKLNFLGLFAGSQISLPFIAPFLVSASIFIGRWATQTQGALSFLAGTSILGSLLGALGFFLSWGILKQREVARKQIANATPWKGEQRGGKLGNLFLQQLMNFVGIRACYICVAIFVVPYFYLFVHKARRASNQYWKTLHPELSFLARQRKVYSHMYVYAGTLLDSLYMSRLGEKAFPLRSSGYEALLETLNRKKGMLMLTAHCGAWYLASRALGRHYFPYDIHIVRYEGQGLTFTQLQGQALAPKEIIINSQNLPTLEIRQALQNCGVVSMMGDRPMGNRLQLLKFMGKWVTLDLSAFRTAMACESAIYYGFGFKENHGGYVFEVGNICTQGTFSNKDEEASALAQEYLRILEGFLKLYPYQWFNWYPYFSFDKKLFSNNSQLKPHSESKSHTPKVERSDKASAEPRNNG